MKTENLRIVNQHVMGFFPLRRRYPSESLQCLTVYFAFRLNLATLVQYAETNVNYLVDRWKYNIQNFRRLDIQLIEPLEEM